MRESDRNKFTRAIFRKVWPEYMEVKLDELSYDRYDINKGGGDCSHWLGAGVHNFLIEGFWGLVAQKLRGQSEPS